MRIEQESLRHSHLEYLIVDAGENKGVVRYFGAEGDPITYEGTAKALNLQSTGANGKHPFVSMSTANANGQHTAIAGNSSYNRPHSLSTYWYIKF